MSPETPQKTELAGNAAMTTLDSMSDDMVHRLADAARFAVLSRLGPVLRHDVAGAMQAPRMLLMVMEKRLQVAEPDLQALAKNVASISALTSQATASCMSALGWIASREDAQISLRTGVEKISSLLAMELSLHALTVVNGIEENEKAVASQSFLRSVFVGALLAFCDQHPEGGSLQVTFKPAEAVGLHGQLHLQLRAQIAQKVPELQGLVHSMRLIDWLDIQAMAQSTGVQIKRGEGWLTVDLP